LFHPIVAPSKNPIFYGWTHGDFQPHFDAQLPARDEPYQAIKKALMDPAAGNDGILDILEDETVLASQLSCVFWTLGTRLASTKWRK